MKASTIRNELKGTSAADISGYGTKDFSLEGLSSKLGIDKNKLKLIGISVYGIDKMWIELICEDLLKSSEKGEPHIVKINPPDKYQHNMRSFFKYFKVVLYSKYDEINPSIETIKESSWEDYMGEE